MQSTQQSRSYLTYAHTHTQVLMADTALQILCTNVFAEHLTHRQKYINIVFSESLQRARMPQTQVSAHRRFPCHSLSLHSALFWVNKAAEARSPREQLSYTASICGANQEISGGVTQNNLLYLHSEDDASFPKKTHPLTETTPLQRQLQNINIAGEEREKQKPIQASGKKNNVRVYGGA